MIVSPFLRCIHEFEGREERELKGIEKLLNAKCLKGKIYILLSLVDEYLLFSIKETFNILFSNVKNRLNFIKHIVIVLYLIIRVMKVISLPNIATMDKCSYCILHDNIMDDIIVRLYSPYFRID